MSEKNNEVEINEKTTIGEILKPWAKKQGWEILEYTVEEDSNGLWVIATAKDSESEFTIEGQFIRP